VHKYVPNREFPDIQFLLVIHLHLTRKSNVLGTESSER
jgi:hypothetical protein